jgi:hypothetical protein
MSDRNRDETDRIPYSYLLFGHLGFSHENRKILMRCPNHISMFCTAYCKLYGSNYSRQALRTHIRSIFAMDPDKLNPEHEAIRFLEEFNKCSSRIPQAVGLWCEFLRMTASELITERCDEVAYQWIHDTLLYRWLSQAITFPEQHNIVESSFLIDGRTRNRLMACADKLMNSPELLPAHLAVTNYNLYVQSLFEVRIRIVGRIVYFSFFGDRVERTRNIGPLSLNSSQFLLSPHSLRDDQRRETCGLSHYLQCSPKKNSSVRTSTTKPFDRSLEYYPNTSFV